MSWLIGLLEDEQHRLAELSALDAVFNDAYRALPADEQQLYRRLAEHPGTSLASRSRPRWPGFSSPRPATCWSGSAPRSSWRTMASATASTTCCGLHARGCAQRDESPAEREETARRAVHFYVHATRAADLAITPTAYGSSRRHKASRRSVSVS